MFFFIINSALPGDTPSTHSPPMHSISSSSAPNVLQFLPPYLGLGLVQLRDLVFVQFALQTLHSDQTV